MLQATWVNKGCGSHQASTLQPPWREALRELRMETNRTWYRPFSSHLLQRSQRVSPEETKDEKAQDPDPESWGAYPRNDLREPRPLYLPERGEALSSLTWFMKSSFTNSNLGALTSWSFVAKPPIYPGSSPCLFRTVALHYLKGTLTGLSSQNTHQIQLNAPMLGRTLFGWY